MLPYLVKHSRSNISNATHELSKELDGANSTAYWEMYPVIKYVLDASNRDQRSGQVW